MRELERNELGLIASGILACLSATAGAQIFTEDFESLTAPGGNFNGAPAGQVTTTHDLVFGANLAGWSNAGAGSVHSVDTNNTWTGGAVSANPQNWGVMFWQDNVITLDAAIAGSNDLGTSYQIDCLVAGAVYEAPSQANNGTSDGIQIEVLRASDSTVLHTFNHTPAPPVGAGDLGLLSVSFSYSGDGSGDILFRIGPSNPNQGRFGGTIDDLELSVLAPDAPQVVSFSATPDVLSDAGEAVTFDWEVGGLPLDSLVITPGDIDVLDNIDGAGMGSHLLDPGPDGTTVYTLTATKGGDSATRMVTVTLPAPEITSFTASPSPVTPGEDLTLTWQVELPVTTLTITPGDIDVKGDTDGSGAGSIIVNPTESTTYTLTATRGTSTSTANALAIVHVPPNPNALFYESFEAITAPAGNFNGAPAGQVTTTHDLVFGASLTGWSGSGGGVIHAVDTHNTWTGGVVSTNPPNWAVMIWQDNVITQTAGIAGSNDSGLEYSIDFLAAGAVYEIAGQLNDGATDNLQVEVLRASDSTVLHTFNHTPTPPVGVGDLGLLPVSYTYTGDGSGDILFRVGPGNPGQGRFQGTIDDLQLSVASASTLELRVSGNGANLDFEWDSKEGFFYNLRTSTDLSADFATWDLVEVDGVFDIPGTPPLNMHSIVRPGDPVRFYRVEEFPPPPLLAENFDDVPGPGLPDGWSTGAGTTAWEVGDPTGGPGPAAAVSGPNCAGTGITGNYAASTTYSLVSPAIAVPAGGATLSFRQYIDTDLAGDVGTIRILDADSADALLEEMNPPGNIEGAAEGWTTESFALPAAAQGMNIKIEFRFGSNGNGQEWAGFYVDNVRVEAN